MDIKPIETRYKGYRFRSRLEARWAVYFDALGIQWEYEKEGYQLASGWYLPDFWLPDTNRFVEIKPRVPDSAAVSESIYLAGKMSEWRDRLQMRGHQNMGPSTGEGSYHGSDIIGPHTSTKCDFSEIVDDCLGRIGLSSKVFCWIDSLDSYATFAEIGYAYAKGKPVFLAVESSIFDQVEGKSNWFWSISSDGHGLTEYRHDLWFLEEMSHRFEICDDPQIAFDKFFYQLSSTEKKCAELAAMTRSTVLLCQGDPYDHQADRYAWWGRELIGCTFWQYGIHEDQLRRAAEQARSARFEHGEKGAFRA